MTYIIFNHNSTYLGEHKTMHKAQEESMLYMGMTGNPAYIKSLDLLNDYERESYDKFTKLLEKIHA